MLDPKPHKPHCFVNGLTLLKIAAAQPPRPGIKVVRGSHIERGVLPADALLLLRNGSYVGKVTARGRLLQIQEIDHRVFVPDRRRWDDRAVLRYGIDLRNIPQAVKNRESTQVWDRLLALDPPPASWRTDRHG